MPDQEGYAKAEDFFVRRDRDDALLPVEEQVAGFGKVLVIPLTYGDYQTYLNGKEKAEDIDDRKLAELLSEKVVRPDLGDVTVERLDEEAYLYAADRLYMAVLRASGLLGSPNSETSGDSGN